MVFDNFEPAPIPVGTEEDPSNHGEYDHAVIEGHYALALAGKPTDYYTAERLASDLAQARENDAVPIDEVAAGHESGYIHAEPAIYALRLALRVLIEADPMTEGRTEALEAIGNALISVDGP